MTMTIDWDAVEEFKARLCDRYTAQELVERLDLEVEDIVEKFLEHILQFAPTLVEEMGIVLEEENDGQDDRTD